MMDSTGPQARPHAVLLAGLSLVAILAVTGASLALDPEEPDTVLSFTSLDSLSLGGEGFVAGVTWMGPDTLAVLQAVPDSMSASGDREVHLVFSDREGNILVKEEFSGVLDRALTWDGEFLYSCGDADDGSSIIYQIQVDTLQVEEAFDAPGHRPTSMSFDGRYVWITDRDSGRLDRFDPETKAITRSVVTPGFSPHGVAWDGHNMWVTDSGTGRMYRLSGGRLKWTATVDTESFLYRGQDLYLLHDGGTFWYVLPQQRLAVELRFD